MSHSKFSHAASVSLLIVSLVLAGSLAASRPAFALAKAGQSGFQILSDPGSAAAPAIGDTAKDAKALDAAAPSESPSAAPGQASRQPVSKFCPLLPVWQNYICTH